MPEYLFRLRNILSIRTKDVWRPIYEEMLPRVFHYFAYRVGDLRAAEDLASATFEKAWRARGQFKREKGAIDQWLFGIAQRVLADHYRQEESRAVDLEGPSIESDFTIEQIAESNHRFQKLIYVLSHQSERSRELISLKYGAGLTNREIAALTGLTETNVGTILHRAVKDLRRQWESNDG